jgi:hypothetical protein
VYSILKEGNGRRGENEEGKGIRGKRRGRE